MSALFSVTAFVNYWILRCSRKNWCSCLWNERSILWGEEMQTLALRVDKPWGPAVQHRELYPITWDGTWWRRMWEKRMYIYVWLGHFAVQQKLTEHCKSAVVKNFFKRKTRCLSIFIPSLWSRNHNFIVNEEILLRETWVKEVGGLRVGLGIKLGLPA